MKNITYTSNTVSASCKVTPLNLDDLASIFGGSDDVIDPDILLGNSSVVIEDIEYI